VPSNIQEAAERRAHETAHLADKMNAHPDVELNKFDEEAMRTMAKQSPKKVCAYVRMCVCACVHQALHPPFFPALFFAKEKPKKARTFGHVISSDIWTRDVHFPCVCRIVIILFLIPKEVRITLLFIPIFHTYFPYQNRLQAISSNVSSDIAFPCSCDKALIWEFFFFGTER
jgi:hypothetical protein